MRLHTQAIVTSIWQDCWNNDSVQSSGSLHPRITGTVCPYDSCFKNSKEQRQTEDYDRNDEILVFVAALGIMNRDWLLVEIESLHKAAVDIIYTGGSAEAPDKANQNVARIMDAEIKASPAVEQRPEDERRCKCTIASEPIEKYGYADGIAGVGREDAVMSTTIPIDDLDHHTNIGLVGRAPTGNESFYDSIVETASNQITNGNGSQHAE